MTKITQAFKNAERGQKERYGFAFISIAPVTLLHPSARYSLLVRQRIRVALGAAAALAAISLSPGSAQAYVVTVGGVQYDVTTFSGKYNDNTSKFSLPPAPGVMPWWGSELLANQFAVAVGGSLGYVNNAAGAGPYFGFSVESTSPFAVVNVSVGNPASTTTTKRFTNQTISRTWAQATSVPVPGPLPLLGAALPLSFCRRLSSRSKRLRHGPSRLA